LIVFAAACLSLGYAGRPAYGEGIADLYPQVRELFPDATRFGSLTGNPPAAAAYQGDKLLGYAYLTKDVLQIPAYSGKPINSLVGIDLKGGITGVRIVEHEEPIGKPINSLVGIDLKGGITGVRIVEHEEPILVVGVTEDDLRRFIEQYRGKSVFDRIAVGGSMRKGDVVIDSISGASITAMVENATVMRSAQRVAGSRGIGKAGVSASARSSCCLSAWSC
jgi:NosR/NirI family nitrous oxide reductase transcriptional regulator